MIFIVVIHIIPWNLYHVDSTYRVIYNHGDYFSKSQFIYSIMKVTLYKVSQPYNLCKLKSSDNQLHISSISFK